MTFRILIFNAIVGSSSKKGTAMYIYRVSWMNWASRTYLEALKCRVSALKVIITYTFVPMYLSLISFIIHMLLTFRP